MKRRWQVFISIVMYVAILAYALDFDILKLIDIKLMLLVLFGTVILAFPFFEKGMQWSELTYIFGRKSIEAGLFQTFLLLFAMLQNVNRYDRMPAEIAMCFRPLLYGFCLLLLLSEKSDGVEKTAEGDTISEVQKNIPDYNAQQEKNGEEQKRIPAYGMQQEKANEEQKRIATYGMQQEKACEEQIKIPAYDLQQEKENEEQKRNAVYDIQQEKENEEQKRNAAYDIQQVKQNKEQQEREDAAQLKCQEVQHSFTDCGLTKREQEIVLLIQAGKSNRDIAAELYISETTVKKHVSNIFEKTGVKRRGQLIMQGKK